MLTGLTWIEAQIECELQGGFLAEPKTIRESEFVEDLAMFSQQLTGISNWFLGLSDLGHEGTWLWMHSDEPVTDAMWAEGCPVSYPSNRDCGVLKLENSNGRWYDVDCMELQDTVAPICQYQHPDDQSTTAGYSTTTNIECLPRWSRFEGHCYGYFFAHVNWILAGQYCKNYGGHLASVHSPEENQFLRDMAVASSSDGSFQYWLGGYDFGNSNLGLYSWTDQTDFDFELFSGYPGYGCLYQTSTSKDWSYTSYCESSSGGGMSFICKI